MVVPEFGLLVVIARDPADGHACLEQELQLLTKWDVKIAVTQDDHACGSALLAGSKQRAPLPVRVTINDDSVSARSAWRPGAGDSPNFRG